MLLTFMRDLMKAQLTVGILACFSMVWVLGQQAINASDQFIAFGIVILQLFAIFILAIILLGILEWVKIFDLKTNAILTFIVIIVIVFSINTSSFTILI
jgi:hypothetical protein